ncbi:MAG: hypothetical protein RMI89_09415 [Gloeomargarita sp. SKYBB_i_bin120]|nr:hypothetical protein [Gloeomargarita sp. SKYG98]MCS7293172.1 hypothetical protein [Gloeomargarita sp. SKYB120]MDW8178737.1 hypothetical protein [Gloeomargarita sp. SKYBB_i_bin120]
MRRRSVTAQNWLNQQTYLHWCYGKRVETHLPAQRIAAVYRPLATNLQRFSKDITDEATAMELVTLLRSH